MSGYLKMNFAQMGKKGNGMRPIDADRLIAQLEIDAKQLHDNGLAIAATAIINNVKHQPTIEPKHGHWIMRCKPLGPGWKYECSECGNIGTDEVVELGSFCPFCGARMEER